MIGKIRGKITEIHGNEGLIETASGVFYQVYLTPSLMQVSTEEQEVYTYTYVKEDQLALFGFETYESYRVFTIFLAVDGVGPKTAFLISSTAKPVELRNAVQDSDIAFFQKIKGIGKKTAQRILVDVSEKMGADFDVAASQQQSDNQEDVLDALISLGFKRKDAIKALEKVDTTLSIEDKVRHALQSLG